MSSPTEFSRLGYSPSFSELKGLISSKFTVLDAYLDERGTPTFIILPEIGKEKFKTASRELMRLNLVPFLRKEGDRYIIRVFLKSKVKKARGRILNLALLLATLGTIFLAGYYGFVNTPILREVLMRGESPYLQAGLFAVSLFAIVGLHELGHMIACKLHGLDFSLPYFIPGPPPFGTFGAIVSLKTPPTNRDELFDIGFAGPFTGFLATLFIAAISLHLGFLVPANQVMVWEQQKLVQSMRWPMSPLLFELLLPLVRPIPQGFRLVLTQVEFAAWVGALLTFLNILPIWQLDGGHISRSVFGASGHRVASMVGLLILVFSGYWFFALFLLLWMFGSGRGWVGAEPLDDVSPLSHSRKLLYLVALIMLLLCFVAFPFY
ncbi:TPA: site-2 protease family protein [Candidatus Bathyarchaeota archaeon]|nr:site-2 protease family protein [Candidatus Bathyarchaeota archaeon]